MLRRVAGLLVQAWLLAVTAPLFGFPVTFAGMSCDLPEGWTVLSTSGEGFAATSSTGSNGTAVLQVSWFSPSVYATPEEALDAIMEKLDARGETAEFTVDGGPAVLAELRFSAGGTAARGYLLSLGQERIVALLAYADERSYEAQHDFLLSTLDSFSLSPEGLLMPGAISQFLWPYPAEGATESDVEFAGSSVPVRSEPGELEAMQSLIEREARVLTTYARHPARDQAWARYYRIIYRDSYFRLAELSRAISRALGPGASREEQAEALLAWLQEFSYRRTGSLSDLLSPLATVVTRSGDCDARALVYAIVLSHLGIDAVLLVSSVYSHAVAAARVQTRGLGLILDGERYVLAETTKKVGLGWIAEEQRDISKWVVVRFDGGS